MTTKRYEFLDGMRGVAALCVVTVHTPDFWNFWLVHSYLAVDLFFLLSGFVIASSYDQKLVTGSYSLKDFLVIRLIRLYPMFFLSVFLAGLAALAKHMVGTELVSFASLAETLLLTSLFIPSATAGRPFLFSINIPYWSLFYELVANVLYGLFRKQLSDRWLIFSVVFFGLILVGGCLERGDLNAGVIHDKFGILIGFSRAMFGFGLGLLVFRKIETVKKLLPSNLPWLGFAGTVLVLLMPSIGTSDKYFVIVSVFFIFPLCLVLCLEGVPGKFGKILSTLGVASYPVYVLHVPVAKFIRILLGTNARTFAPFGGFVLLAFLFVVSLWLEKNLDNPIRRRLTLLFRPETKDAPQAGEVTEMPPNCPGGAD